MPSLYVDRKMLKWLPFQSLPEQGDDLAELFADPLPLRAMISEDAYALMQYRFETAYLNKEKVTITYFQNHRKQQIEDIILGVDLTRKALILSQEVIPIDAIVCLE